MKRLLIFFFYLLIRKLFFSVFSLKLVNRISKNNFSMLLGRFQKLYFVISFINLCILKFKLLFQTLDSSFPVYNFLFLIKNLILWILQFCLQTKMKNKLMKNKNTFQHFSIFTINLTIHNWAAFSSPSNYWSKTKFFHSYSSITNTSNIKFTYRLKTKLNMLILNY